MSKCWNVRPRIWLPSGAGCCKPLSALQGVRTFDSSANFILFRVPDAVRVFAGLKQRGILIKNLHGGHPLLDNCLRVTVGAPQENDAFLAALSAELKIGKLI